MDNICHSLIGAALGAAGLQRRSRLATTTLVVASNLPDIDVLVFATSTPAVAFRRGWTHGVLAQALLPLALAALMVWLASRRPPRPGDPPVSPIVLVLLSYLGVGLHVVMDFLNNYGVRVLAPIDWRWFYGDTLFIVDPWLWLILGGGVWLARRRPGMWAARVTIVTALLYVGSMLGSARAARAIISDAWAETEGSAPRALMVGPVPVTPLRRAVIIDAGDRYVTGEFSWWPRAVSFAATTVPKNDDDARVSQARAAPPVQAFLVWSRFPFWTLERVDGGTRVTVRDMRFAAVAGAAGRLGARFEASAIVPD